MFSPSILLRDRFPLISVLLLIIALLTLPAALGPSAAPAGTTTTVNVQSKRPLSP